MLIRSFYLSLPEILNGRRAFFGRSSVDVHVSFFNGRIDDVIGIRTSSCWVAIDAVWVLAEVCNGIVKL